MEKVEINGKEAVVKVDPDMFSFDVVKSAAYVFLDKAYFSFGGSLDGVVEVFIEAKEGEDIEEIIKEFRNEMISYSVYEKEAERNKEVREAIVERALATTLEGDFEGPEDITDFLSPDKEEGE